MALKSAKLRPLVRLLSQEVNYQQPASRLRPLVRCLSAPASQEVMLNYQQPDPQGRQMGRYINQADRGDVVDVCEERGVTMRSARAVEPHPRLETHGFECRAWPTKVTDFGDDEEVRSRYYGEMTGIVRAMSGASMVYVFDHTIRDTGLTNLNAEKGGAAAPVPRVHCDYTAEGAPRRLRQLLESDGVYDGQGRRARLSESEISALLESNFAFVNVWRSISSEPVQRSPLAVLDERSVKPDEIFKYELRFPDRTGENYSLKHSPAHEWYYYPEMTPDECLVFKCYDRKEDGPRFVFHTAFDDPMTQDDAPPRRSIEARTIAFFPRLEGTPNRLEFFDMQHSNNAARIRLWLNINTDRVQRLRGSVPVDRRVVTYPDLATENFAQINPLKKVPALIRHDGATVFESDVIVNYLEDKFGNRAFTADTPEDRQVAALIVRCHDLYVSSPNSTQPGFSHSQGAMYLSNAWHGPRRGMSIEARAAKLAELWKQLTWLDNFMVGNPFLAGDHLTLADLTWYPTCVFMEYLLPRVFDWPQIFIADADATPIPRLAQWYYACHDADPAFLATRDDILRYWKERDDEGQFDPIRHEVASRPDFKWHYP